MQLTYKRNNGVKILGFVDNEKMWPISSILHRMKNINYFKNKILQDISNNIFNTYGLSDELELIAIDNKCFTIIYTVFEPNPDNDIIYEITVPQQAFWDLLDEYSKVINTDWKKIIIDFDGKKFDLNIEN